MTVGIGIEELEREYASRPPIENEIGLFDLLFRDGGFTADPETLRPVLNLDSGYGVSGDHGITVFALLLSPRLFWEAFRELAENARKTAAYVGAWIDRETGIVHLDVTDVYLDRASAIFAGKRHGQKCVWDFARECAIPV